MRHFIWNIRPELFVLGPVEVRWYGFFFACAFLFGLYHMERRVREEGLFVNTDGLLISLMVGTLAGARLVHCLFYEPGYYLTHPLEVVMVWRGGLASHGGLLGFLLGLWLFTWRGGAPFLRLLDLLTVPAAFGGALVRLGNFFNSEIVGIPSDLPWAVVFLRVDGLSRHPVQLYESLACLLVFLLLYVGDRAGLSKGRGLLSGLFLVAIFGSRMALEPFKIRQAAWAVGFPLSLGQMLSIPMILAGGVLGARGIHSLVAKTTRP